MYISGSTLLRMFFFIQKKISSLFLQKEPTEKKK